MNTKRKIFMTIINKNKIILYADEALYRDYLDFYQNCMLIAEKKYNRLLYSDASLSAYDMLTSFFGFVDDESFDKLILSNDLLIAKFEIC